MKTSDCSHQPKLIATGIAPLGIIAIGVVPMGVIAIGVVPMGVVSLGAVGMGLISVAAVNMGVVTAGITTMGVAWAGLVGMGPIRIDPSRWSIAQAPKESTMFPSKDLAEKKLSSLVVAVPMQWVVNGCPVHLWMNMFGPMLNLRH